MIIVSEPIFGMPGKRDAFLGGSRQAITAARKGDRCRGFSESADIGDAAGGNVLAECQSQKTMFAFRRYGPGDDPSTLIERAEVRRHSNCRSSRTWWPGEQPGGSPALIEN